MMLISEQLKTSLAKSNIFEELLKEHAKEALKSYSELYNELERIKTDIQKERQKNELSSILSLVYTLRPRRASSYEFLKRLYLVDEYSGNIKHSIKSKRDIQMHSQTDFNYHSTVKPNLAVQKKDLLSYSNN